MAITRCPYCHAIIDEADKYCNNCGTQLLFAEDDEVEEEIPGEKIIDAEVEEKDYTVNEPEEEKRRKPAKDLDSEIDKELAEGLGAETEGPRLDEIVEEEEPEADDVTEEVILVDEIEASEKAGTAASEELAAPAGKGRDAGDRPDVGEGEPDEDRDDEDDGDLEVEEDAEDEDLELLEDEEAGEEREVGQERDEAGSEGQRDEARQPQEKEEKEEEEEGTQEFTAATPPEEPPAVPEPLPAPLVESEPEVEYVVEPEPPDEASTAGEAAFRAATFDTKELESLGRTVELSKAKVDEIIENLSARRPPTPPPEPEPEPWPAASTPPALAPTPPAPAPVPAPEPEGTAPGPKAATPTGSLPPWASTMKGAPVFSEDSGPVETRKFRRGTPPAAGAGEEVEIFPRKRGVDSTIGLPEKIGQSPLPFDEAAAEPDEAESEEMFGEAGAEEEEAAAAERTGSREVTPEEVVLPGGTAKPARGSILPGREPAAGRETEAEAADDDEEAEERPPFSFSVFVKSKAFDVLFVGLFWLVALWLAAASLGVTLFAVLASMSGSMLLLYAVFLIIYVFLFKFFLGETLGDRLFKPRD